MKGAVIFRLLCITALWLLICGWLIDRMVKTGTELNLRTLFPVIASGIIIFVPLYKKYIRDAKAKKDKGNGRENRH